LYTKKSWVNRCIKNLSGATELTRKKKFLSLKKTQEKRRYELENAEGKDKFEKKMFTIKPVWTFQEGKLPCERHFVFGQVGRNLLYNAREKEASAWSQSRSLVAIRKGYISVGRKKKKSSVGRRGNPSKISKGDAGVLGKKNGPRLIQQQGRGGMHQRSRGFVSDIRLASQGSRKGACTGPLSPK